jgi:glycosyltransferase involved in cell wall biosynthesis
MINYPFDNSINLVGHPYAPIGMGEHIRCTLKALQKVGVSPLLNDVYEIHSSNDYRLGVRETKTFGPINIFHINGDEVDPVLKHLTYNDDWSGYNIIYPAWELETYPSEWAEKLDGFDEIWAQSKFTYSALKKACTKPIVYLPEPCEVNLDSFLARKNFGIPEAAYIFLFFFDVRSYMSRKNPQGVIEAFKKLVMSRPYSRTKLVLKVSGVELNPTLYLDIELAIKELGDRVILIKKMLTDNEVKNLIRCCDCFISLHRSEGFGRGIGEAMCLGKPVIATAYSGNLDFMDLDCSFGVGYQLVSLKNGDYPHWENQVWADPDIDMAVNIMTKLVDNPGEGIEVGRRAKFHMITNFNYQVIGCRYLERLDHIAQNLELGV